MMKQKKIVCVCIAILLPCTILSALSACNNIASELSETKPIKVEIKQFDSYEITDMNELETTLKYSSVSTDDTVAVLRSGKYLYGIGEGQATVTVNDGESEIVYDVTVVPDTEKDFQPVMPEDRGLTAPENEYYIGMGYNAFQGEELDEFYINKNKPKQILDWQKIYNSNQLRYDSSSTSTTEIFTGQTVSDFIKSYSEKTTIKATVKVFGIKSYETSKTYQNNSSSQSNDTDYHSQIYIKKKTHSYFFSPDGDKYNNYILPEVTVKLLGLDGTSVEEFIEEYGTHVIVRGEYGGSFEYTYSINDKDTLNRLTTMFNCDSDELSDEIRKYIINKDSRITNTVALNSTTRILPFTDTQSAGIYNGLNLEQAADKYNNMQSNIRNEYDEIAYLGSGSSNSLIAVWELLPNTENGKSRKNKFIEYIKQTIEK